MGPTCSPPLAGHRCHSVCCCRGRRHILDVPHDGLFLHQRLHSDLRCAANCPPFPNPGEARPQRRNARGDSEWTAGKLSLGVE